jgi:hypothetical protein
MTLQHMAEHHNLQNLIFLAHILEFWEAGVRLMVGSKLREELK